MRAVAVIDGEHYADVVRATLAELPYEFVAAVLAGGVSAWNTMPLLAVTWPPPTFTAVTRVGVAAPSSLRMVPVAAAVPMVVPALGFDKRRRSSRRARRCCHRPR